MPKALFIQSGKGKQIRILPLTLGLCILLLPGQGFAEDDPFSIDSGKWSSFDTYTDNSVRHPELNPPKPVEAPAPVLAEPEPPTPAQPEPAPEAKPEETEIHKTFLTPAMPGMNKGFQIDVTSTNNGTAVAPVAKSSHDAPDSASQDPAAFQLAEKNWAPIPLKGAKAAEENEDGSKVNVRMPFLPLQNMTPTPSPERESAQKRARALLKKEHEAAKKAAEKTPEEKAACEALDAYKKQQLDSLQSDKETLAALQDAIQSLGLSKKLDFLSKTATTQSVPAAK